MADVLTEILRAANKHPNSRVSKLIHTVAEEPTQKNVVLLLIELAEHTEYSIDFNVSLKYYLNLFEHMGLNHELVLNEAGLLLVNASKIYSKRVDYVQSLVERQILTLSNADDEIQKQKMAQQQNENAAPAEKPKRGRKRALEAPSDPYEVELIPKKFKKLTEEKRFAIGKTVIKFNSKCRNIEMEQHIHPAGWQQAVIYDLENEEDVDTKRNYKLFTYHVEHRYNTLVPDINFRLHFKVKDYIDAQEEMEEDEACYTDRSWPPLSEAYVQKYLNLENLVLQQDMKTNKRKMSIHDTNTQMSIKKQTDTVSFNAEPVDVSPAQINTCSNNDTLLEQSIANTSEANTTSNLELSLASKPAENIENSNVNLKNDSGLGQSILNETNNTLQNTQLNCTLETSTTAENVNDMNLSEANKSLNATQCQEDNLLLGTSSGNIENNESLNSTASTGNVNESTVEETCNSLNVTGSQQENDSALSNSLLDQTNNLENNTTIESSVNLEITQEATAETSEILDASLKLGEKVTIKDITVSDGVHNSTATENSVTLPKENLNAIEEENRKRLKIDVTQQQNETHQIRVHLPHTDDEGVYFSDLDEHDCRLLSPIIKTQNVLPGVERKDVTIVMDDELRQALEIRDGIIEHFGHHIYKLPVITEPKPYNLVFNIFKLPEKLLKKKVLFKLGPDMDLFRQARSLKRSKPEPVGRGTRNTQLLEWFSLNNTDMTGVCLTPPNSPGHSSDFCGFSEEEVDSVSCVEFCGFTEEEQSMLTLKHISRLSRDSGVGVDVNNLTPEKEKLVNIFEERDAMQNTQSILDELPTEIREALTKELEENTENITGTTTTTDTEKSCTQTDKAVSETITDFSDTAVTSTASVNTEQTAIVCSESSIENTQCVSTENSTQESGISLSEKSSSEPVKVNPESTDKETESCNTKQTERNKEELFKERTNSDNSNDIEILDLDAQGSKTKIQQWHEYLQPILAKSRERHHFDVYKLGTEIIETIQSRRNSYEELLDELEEPSPATSTPVASFHDIMDNKDKSYVSRYFLSTLLLANQSNIEIFTCNKSSESPSSWHDINLKLLSTKRHTVAMEDNIGIIDKKCREKLSGNKVTEHNHEREEGNADEPLIKLQKVKKSTKAYKTTLKRSNDSATTSFISDKKLKEITEPTIAIDDLIQNVQVTTPPLARATSSVVNTLATPSTSRESDNTNGNYDNSFKFTSSAIRTLQPIKKVQKRSEDHDSGIFSIDEMYTS